MFYVILGLTKTSFQRNEGISWVPKWQTISLIIFILPFCYGIDYFTFSILVVCILNNFNKVNNQLILIIFTTAEQ